jgi:DNA-binding SARP family transcriptional activator
MAVLCVAVLGRADVRHGQRCLTFPTRKTLAVLVYVLVEGGLHPRDKLTALFWPDSDEVSGRANLRTTLARLREGLEATTEERHLVIDRNFVGFEFASAFELDLHLLQSAYALARSLTGTRRPSAETGQTVISQLQQAADTWRGEFLEGFSLRDAPDFDEWTTLQRETWRKRMEVVLDRLSLLYADAGSTASAIETADRWAHLNPLEEHAYRRLMRLHFTAGDRAAALRAYEQCRLMLEKELGVLPDPETSALAERVRIAPRSPRSSSQPRSLPAASPLDKPLVGRADEFTKVVELYHAASQGRPQAALLQGEAGIGKTRLATEFLAWAVAQGAEVLQGRAFETGARLPYQPLVDALRPRLDQETGLEARLSSVWLTELSRVLPELRDRYPSLPLPTGDEAAARTRLFEALVRLGQVLADRAPLVLFIDDVQWADVASLDLLHYAGRRWAQDETPILLLCCLRSEALATTPVLDEWLLGLRRDLAVTRIDLGPLTFEDTVQLMQGLTTALDSVPEVTAFARWIFAETSGQPFYVVETLRMLLEHPELRRRHADVETSALDIVHVPERGRADAVLPPSVRQIIQTRLAPLPQTARDLLAAAGILGQRFSFELLCHVARLTENEALPALDMVLRSHLLREIDETEAPTGEGQYIFAHDKIRDVVYREAGEARRRVFHRRALEVLQETGAPAAELTRHALAASLDEPALQFSVAAGEEAMRLLAARDAASHFERAITLAERLGRKELLAELHARRGHAFVTMAAWPDARSELEAALAGFAGSDPDRYAEILTDVGEACWWMLDIPAIHRYATEILTLADQLGRGDLETKAMAWLAAAEGSAGNLSACLEQNQRAIDRARALGIAPPAITGHYHPITLYWLGRYDEAVAVGRDAVAVAQEGGDISWVMSSLPHLGMALAGTGQYAEAIRVFDEARRLGHEYGLGTLLARAISMSVGFRLDIFDFAGAEALAREARDLARSLDFAPPAVSAGIDLLLSYARREDASSAETLIDEVTAVAERTSGFHGWLWKLRLAEARAEIALARGDSEAALQWANDAVAQSRTRGRVKYEVTGLTTRAQSLIGLSHTKEAIVDLRTAVALARPIEDPALFLRPAAALLMLDGDDALAEEGRAAVNRITEALPVTDMRSRFEQAEPVRILLNRG